MSSASFLEVKILITSWFLSEMKMEEHLKFDPSSNHTQLLQFIRESKNIKHLFEEDDGSTELDTSFFSIKKLQFSLHVIGAMSYSIFVTAAIILNEIHEEKVAWITGISFIMFSALGYVSGAYVPVFRVFRLWVLLWNPFMREPKFLKKLQEVCICLCLIVYIYIVFTKCIIRQ